MQPYRKWQRYLRVGIRAIGRWLLSTERKKIIIGRRQQAVESYGADMHCETAPPCSSFQLSVFLMFWFTCVCREDRLLFQAWNERTLLVIGKRGRSVTPSERGPILLSWSTQGGWEKSFVESLGLGWRVSDSNESRGGNCWEDLGAGVFESFQVYWRRTAEVTSNRSALIHLSASASLSWSNSESSKCGSLLSRRTGGTVVPLLSLSALTDAHTSHSRWILLFRKMISE